jgi:aminopeptidase N
MKGLPTILKPYLLQWLSGKEAGSAYNKGARKNIRNDKPILGIYNVHNTGSGDMYPKASAMLHSIRMSMNNDEKFRQLLRHLNKKFYHQIVTTPMIEKEISLFAGYSVKSIFTQYLNYYTSSFL